MCHGKHAITSAEIASHTVRVLKAAWVAFRLRSGLQDRPHVARCTPIRSNTVVPGTKLSIARSKLFNPCSYVDEQRKPAVTEHYGFVSTSRAELFGCKGHVANLFVHSFEGTIFRLV